MKTITLNTILAILVLLVIMSMINIFFILNKEFLTPADNNIVFVWKNKDAVIPKPGTLIRIEYVDKNTVYIGPISNSKK